MTGRLQSIAFVLLCLAGAVASIALTIRTAAQTAPIAVSVATTSRTGAVTTVTVSVRNTTGDTRCVAIRVAGRDRTGHDLASVTAVRRLSLPPHGHRSVTARLTLTRRQYSEQLHAFYPSAKACGP